MGLFYFLNLTNQSINPNSMKASLLLKGVFIFLIITGCSSNVEFSQEHIEQTSGRYLYNLNEVIDVYYEDNKLYLKWKGAEKIKPVVLDENTFFVADMYQKLRFVKHPKTKERYLGVVSEDDDSKVTYEYIKVTDSFKTPSMHLKAKNFEEAQKGFLELQKEDPQSPFLREYDFNRLGYNYLRQEKFEDAIAVFNMNVALYPESDNVYDSLADAYKRSGDSLEAYSNYKKALELNSGNERAKEFVKGFEENQN